MMIEPSGEYTTRNEVLDRGNTKAHHPPMNPDKAQFSRNFRISTTIFCQLLVCLIATFSSGCVAIPEGSASMKERALGFVPPANKAGIYVIRPARLTGAAWPFSVSIDYSEIGSLNVNSYLYTVVSPGKHVLHFPGGSALGSTIIAEVGKNYFFTVKPKWISTNPFDAIEEAEGMVYVRKYKLSGDSRLELQSAHEPLK